MGREGDQLLQEDLQTYAAINQELVVRPDDTWEQVVFKAITLRQLGRTQEALAAFAQYGEMFKETDETAQQYADTARQFTLQMEVLGVVDGAVYIFAIVEGSAAHKAGLAVGDIVIACNEQPIRNVPDLEKALAAIAGDESIQLGYLRLDQAGILQHDQVTINNTSLGISYMPI